MIFIQLDQQLSALKKLLSSLSDQQYQNKIAHLGNASIGSHTRHIIELLQCAVEGCHSGEIDYINRTRDLRLETDRFFAQTVLQQLTDTVNISDRTLILTAEEDGATTTASVTTSYYREIVYNTEHTIHHLALIKVAIIEMKLDVVDNNFGMAYSTIKYRASLNK